MVHPYTDGVNENSGENVVIVTYDRNSPPQSSAALLSNPASVEVYREWMADFLSTAAALSNGIIVGRYSDPNASSRRVGKKTRPGLHAAIEHVRKEMARGKNAQLWVGVSMRLGRGVIELLQKRYPDIKFHSVISSDESERNVRVICWRLSVEHRRKHDPEFGRPVDIEAHNQLPQILGMIGRHSCREIAKALGPGWSDRKVKRLLDRLMPYTGL